MKFDFFFRDLSEALKYGKTGNKKHATCFVVVIAKTEKNLY